MRKHPDPDRIREVMNAIREVRTDRPDLSDIHMQSIHTPSCGTPGCHAGDLWLGMIRLGIHPLIGEFYTFTGSKAVFTRYMFHKKVIYSRFENNIMDSFQMEKWARKNPDLWGNDEGYVMFSDCSAFGMDSDMFPPHVITDHWFGVADRIEKEIIEGLVRNAVENPDLVPPVK